MRKLIQDSKGIELPIAIVVMLVVGVAALAALLAILGAAPGIPKRLDAEVIYAGGEGSILIYKGRYEYVIRAQVSAAGSPVADADCVLKGLGVVASNRSGNDGIVGFKQVFILPVGVEEACLELICRKPGYQEFSDECAVRVIRGK